MGTVASLNSRGENQAHGVCDVEIEFGDAIAGHHQRIAADLIAHWQINRDPVPIVVEFQLFRGCFIGDEADQQGILTHIYADHRGTFGWWAGEKVQEIAD